MSDDSRVEALIAAGRLKEALSLIRARRQHSRRVELERLTLEMQAGDPAAARRGAEGILASQPNVLERVACLNIVGHVLGRSGSWEGGVQLLRTAFELACTTKDDIVTARQLASLVAGLLHWVGFEPAVSELGHLRRRALYAGDAYSLVEFHHLAAEVQIKRRERGAVAQLRGAEGLLTRYPNLVQLADLNLLKGNLAASRSEPHEALSFWRAALGHAEDAGANTKAMVALANIAHFLLSIGDLGECERHLSRAMRLVQAGSGLEIGANDTRLQLAMAQGDTIASERLAESLSEMSERLDQGHSNYGLWHSLTRVRWLMRTGRAEEAVRLALDTLPHITRLSDRTLLERMQLLAAEGLARTGRAAEGARLMADAVVADPEPALEMIAEAARVAGHLAARDNRPAALAHFERSIRVLSTIGNITARGEVIRHAVEACAAREGPGPPGPPTASPAASHLPDPTSDPVDTSASVPAHVRSPAAVAAETAGAIMDLAAHAPLFGHEVLALIVRAQAADAAALLASSNGSQDVLVSSGCEADEARRLEAEPNAVRIELGTHADRRLEVVARPGAEPSTRVTLLAIERLARASRALYAARQREREQAALWPEQTAEQQLGMVFAAESMVDLVKTTRRIATANITVLITGETGTGKELLARALHEASSRRELPFVPFNCTAVAKDMLDAQLFGYRRGAFTGAHDPFSGVIRAAAGGTLFLDEIGEIGLDVQPKLLRFMESGEIHPLGEPRPLSVDVRIVAATNANLDQLVADGRFREDLYYRLNVVRLPVPPLRERREEIPLFVEHFLDKYGQDAKKLGLRVAEETMEYLVLYRWPGNVRQLANELRRMVALAEPGAVLMPEHLSKEIAASRRTIPASERDLTPKEVVVRLDQPLSASTEHLERTALQYALKESGGRMDDAARALGLSRKGLYLKRQRLGLD